MIVDRIKAAISAFAVPNISAQRPPSTVPGWLREGEIVYIVPLDASPRDFTVYDVMRLDGENAELADIKTGKRRVVHVRDFAFSWAGDVLY